MKGKTIAMPQVDWAYFSSYEKVKSLLQTKFPAITPRVIEELTSYFIQCISQAEEYFKLAAQTTLLTQPTLLFYGIVALGKSVVAATVGKAPYELLHGLTARVVAASEEAKDFVLSEEPVQVKEKGAFASFQNCYAKAPLQAGTKLTIGELFSVVPELREEYEKVYRESSRVVTKQQLLAGQKSLSCRDLLAGEELFIVGFRKDNRLLLIPELSSHYILAFILSMLARYEPSKWYKVLKDETAGEYKLVKRFAEISIIKFPRLALGLLVNPGK